MKIFKGKIITVDSENSVKSYLGIDNGRIVFVTDELPSEYIGFEIEDLGKGAILPSFVDTHGHFASYAMLAAAVKLDKAKSNREKLELLRQADCSTKKGKSLFCFGASPYVAEGRFLTGKDIDEVAPKRAVAVVSTDGHTIILNRKARNKMPKAVKRAEGYDDENGVIRGECFSKVIDNMLSIINPLDGLQSFQEAYDDYCAKGFGLVSAECGIGMPFDLDVELLKWIYRGQKMGAKMRFFIQSFDVKKAKKRKLNRLGGCFECALDGSITSEDAALTSPYCGTDNYGKLNYTEEELYRKIMPIHKAGMSFQMHAIGDAAVTQATKVYKRILDEFPRENHRHGIIHATFVNEEAMDIIEKCRLQIAGQPAFIEMNIQYYDLLMKKLGKGRCLEAEPHSEFIRRGVVFTAGSDCPVTFPDAISWIHWMVNNPNVEHRVDLTNAIRVCTYNGCYATFDEKERGSLEAGKIADFVILSDSPYDIASDKIKDVKVSAVYYDGVKWQKRKVNIISTILKGFFKRNVKL